MSLHIPVNTENVNLLNKGFKRRTGMQTTIFKGLLTYLKLGYLNEENNFYSHNSSKFISW
jgi:hypothetical protein